MPWEAVAASIAAATGAAFRISDCTEVGGGCINRGYRLAGSVRVFFVKLNRAGRRAMFDAEAEGLHAIAKTGTVRVPVPLCTGEDAGHCWLVLEFLDLAPGGAGTMAALGQQLAGMHRSSAERFGWHRDNTIGATPQIKRRMASWIEFWRTAAARVPARAGRPQRLRWRPAAARRAIADAARRAASPMTRRRRCCTAICGAATRQQLRPASRCCSTRPATTATARPIWP